MKYYLNTETFRGFETKSIIEAAIDYDGFELWYEELTPELKNVIKGREILSLTALKGWFELDPTLMGNFNIMDECLKRIDIAAEWGAKYVIAVPSRSDRSYYAEMEDGLTRWYILEEYAKKAGVKLALEFIGASSQINTLKSALFAENIVFDIYHHWRGNGELIKSDKIKIIHISDVDPNILKKLYRDRQRILPGDGVLEIGKTIKSLDFDGPVSLGVYNPKYWWDGDLKQMAKEFLEKMKNAVLSS